MVNLRKICAARAPDAVRVVARLVDVKTDLRTASTTLSAMRDVSLISNCGTICRMHPQTL